MLALGFLALLLAPQQATCSATVVYEENFDHGVFPPGWTNTDWILASPPVCAAQCGSVFLATYFNPGCDCTTTSGGGCAGNADLVSPAIALPALAPGQILMLDFCFEGFLDTFLGDCNELGIRYTTGQDDFKIGPNVALPCPGPTYKPPFDLSAYAGQTINLVFHAGNVDAEGDLRMTIDDISIVLFDGDPDTDCNSNGMPDGCDIVQGNEQDCNANLLIDSCEISSGTALDCNANSVPDDCTWRQGPASISTPTEFPMNASAPPRTSTVWEARTPSASPPRSVGPARPASR